MQPGRIALILVSVAASQNAGEPASLKDAFRNAFRVGAAINRNLYEGRDTPRAALVAAQFNTITPENDLKWQLVHPRPGEYYLASADRYVEFGEKNHMFVVGHCLVWHNQTPGWVFEDEAGRPLSRQALLERMRDHIFTVMGRYRGRIRGWDVVNEAVGEDGGLRESPWLKIIGRDYVAKAFEYAREADPKAELYYNDYGLENGAKRKGAIELIRTLKEGGAKVTAVGLQGHFRMDAPAVEQVDAAIADFAALGVKVNITELDVDVLPRATRRITAEVTTRAESRPELNPYTAGLPEEVAVAQASRYSDLFRVFMKHTAEIERVTFWGVDDGVSWLNNFPVRGRVNYPLLFDRAHNPKPAFDAVLRIAASPDSKTSGVGP